jgi:hypothetical protein
VVQRTKPNADLIKKLGQGPEFCVCHVQFSTLRRLLDVDAPVMPEDRTGYFMKRKSGIGDVGPYRASWQF